jgi:hypothetical protein
MMLIGFSTGALAFSDFRRALGMLREEGVEAVELSALRMPEWFPLLDALSTLDLSSFRYVSVHLPSQMRGDEERSVAESLQHVPQDYPLILHPDAISDFGFWRGLDDRLCIENMDSRKPAGRTEWELDRIFDQLPRARLCFDIGHAWHVDPTMNVAYGILKCYCGRIVQVHVSEVNSRSKHDILSYSTMQAFRDVAHLVPRVPLILETPVSQRDMCQEINKARFAFLPMTSDAWPSKLAATTSTFDCPNVST